MRFYIRLSYLAVLLLLGGMTSTLQPVNAQTETLATVEPLAGIVQIKPAEAEDWESISAINTLSVGDMLRTDGAGWALITFFDGAYTEVLADTELLITSLDLPEMSGGLFSISFDLRVGDTFNTLNAIVNSGSRFDVTMPGMTAAVRGTIWQTKVLPSGCSAVYTFEGEVATFSNLITEPIMVRVGEYIVYDIEGALDPDLEPDFQERPDPASQSDDETEPDLSACGDGFCDRVVGEGLLTCSADCSSPLDVDFEELKRRMEADNARR